MNDDEIKCVRCGETFDSRTARTMHTIRKRCPEIETEADLEAADYLHGLSDVVDAVTDEDGEVRE